MSHYWTYECRTCGPLASEHLEPKNHGRDHLQELWIERKALREFRERFLAKFGLCVLEVASLQFDKQDTWFVMDHHDHDVVLRDEYGVVIEL